MSEYSTNKHENGLAAFLFIVLLFLTGYILMLKTQTINPFTKELNPNAYGMRCGTLVAVCRDIAAIDCHAEQHGAFYYVNKKTGEIIGHCGGDCPDGKCDPNTCPPQAWDCTAVRHSSFLQGR